MTSFIKILNPFSRKPSLEHPKSQVRLAALAQLNLATEAESFLAWLTQEEDLPTLEAGLASLTQTSEHQQLLAKLAEEHQPLSLTLIKLAPNPRLALSCLAALTADESTWLELALNCKTTQLRQAAAEKLTSEEALTQLAEQARNDKSLQRYARQQLEAIKTQQEAEAALQAALAEVLTQLEELTRASDQPLFSAKLQHLTNKWQEVASQANSAQLANYQELTAQAKQQEAAILAEEARLKRLEEEKQRQADEAAKQAALAEEARQAKAAKEAQLAAQKKAAAQKNLAEAAAIKAQQAELKHQAKQLADEIKRLEKLIQQGQIQAATRLNSRLNQELTNPQLAAAISANQQQLHKHLTAKLNELNSWQGFAAAPKRQELVEQMQALAADLTMQPQVKADKIQQLQHQWRELGSAAANKESWLAFKEAADTAFEPCKAYFAEQKQLQTYNEDQRQIICAELEKLAARQGQQELNEAALDTLLQEVHNEWHRFSPVSRSQGKKLAQRFQQAIQPLKDQLYALRQVNIEAKRELIAQAEALLNEENLNAAIETNKQLQENWRELGRAPGSLEPRLWKEFRAACDALFNKRAEINLAKVEASQTTYEAALAELNLAEQALAANNLAAAKEHLATSHSQGLTQKHLRLLASKQQEIKTALSQHKQQAALTKQAKKLEALLATFSPSEQQPAEALKQLIYLEILTQQPSAPANQQLRLELQIELMNQGAGSLSAKETYQQLVTGLEELQQLGLGQQSKLYSQLQQLVANFLQAASS